MAKQLGCIVQDASVKSTGELPCIVLGGEGGRRWRFHVSSRLVTLQGMLRTVLSGFGTLLPCGESASASSTPTLGHLLGLGTTESGWLWGTGTGPGKGMAVAAAGATLGLALADARRRLGGGARLAAVRGAAVPAARLASRGFATTCVGLKR